MKSTTLSPTILITTLAMYQTEFWAKVGKALKQQGHEVAYLSFDDRSTELLNSLGFETFSATQKDLYPDTSDASFNRALLRFQIRDANFWFGHERFAFGIRESSELRRKLLAYLTLADRACMTLCQAGRQVCMVQELGGFVSVIASFFAARLHGIDNWFIEPAFFRGRMFFLKNSFAAPRIDVTAHFPISDEVRNYLAKTLENGAIVVPKKDRHQYTTAFKKVVNFRNVRRLGEKLVDKHIRGKHQEFGYIGRHVAVHGRMLLNSLRLRAHYTLLEDVGRFVYYPLHVPGDMALTLRSPQYLDQIALVEYLARIVPHTHRVAIKEHPAMIGAMNADRLLELLRRYDNVVLLPPSTNNYKVLHATDAVVSVNSKSGAEAALLSKPVLVLGDAFYRNAPMVMPVDKITDLPELLNAQIGTNGRDADKNMIESYFEQIWQQCYPGELYVTDIVNINQFASSLINATR